MSQTARLIHFPVSAFAVVMGLGGLAIAWQQAEAILRLPFQLSPGLLYFATLMFAVLAVLYGLKWVNHGEAVRQEWAHPVKMNFIPTFSIALLLLADGWLSVDPNYSLWLWIAGSGVQLLLTLYIVSWWVHHNQFEIAHLNPAWFIPVVGNILVPIAGVHHAPLEVSWFFFSIGLLFWPILLAIIFYRVIFHGSLPERFLPTLFILIAPPAVGFNSYINLTGSVDAFAQVLYNSGVFFTLLLFFQAKWFTRFRISRNVTDDFA
jgi:tellurite resistance protein